MGRAVNTAALRIPAFDGLWDDVMGHRKSEFWMKGGRGSTKSSFISLCIVLLVVQNPWANAVCVRRFGNTLRDSVYAQISWAISELGLSEWFDDRKSPLEFVYRPTGQRIVFRGLDDPLKAKSVKFDRGYCAISWFEELDQLRGWDDVSSALKSFRRGGDAFWTFYSYNPPKSAWNWVNEKAEEMAAKPGCSVHHSTYLDVVEGGHADWLGRPFVDEAEYLRDTNETAYRWEMLGEVTGTGGNVFDNIKAEPITDAEIAGFEHFRNGVDWGWFPDPWRFVRCAYVKRTRSLYVFEEHHEVRKEAVETARIVRAALTYPDRPGDEPRYHRQRVWCDDTADGKQQMATYRREEGLDARPARKGSMRDLSYQWLAGLREIVIDPVRCPLTLKEFRLKEFERDKDGRWCSGIPDGEDHSIDAVRYAVMEDVIETVKGRDGNRSYG